MFQVKNLKYKNIINIPSLTIENKTQTAIVGQSGSGKTTFLKLLDRLFHADCGDIFYNGTNIFEIANYRRIITMVAQQPVVYTGTVEYNLKIAFEYCNKPIPPNNVLKEVLKVVCLDVDLDADTKMFSGGEKSRLCIARALCLNSETYLIDEPTSALDGLTQTLVMQNIIDYLHNKTLIVVTHSNESSSLCQHCFSMSKGGDVEWVR